MARHQSQSAHQHGTASTSALRSRFDDSWVEVSSRPSSSSLSSVGDEVITTGLRIQQNPATSRRNRRLRRSLPEGPRPGFQSHAHNVASSQEEYDESASESDPVMSSSSEGAQQRSSEDDVPPIQSVTSRQISYASEDGDVDDDDDEENATAVGTTGNAVFTPQPSAFSHPPRLSRHNSTSAPLARSRRPSATHHRHSFSVQQHSPYNMMSPSHNIDHEAALRASLSTLLSYAAATRGAPKTAATQRHPEFNSQSNRIQPATIGLMPESVAFPETKRAESSKSENEDKGKRKARASTAAHGRSDSKDRRAAKKRRSSAFPAETITAINGISPTLLTWVVGAGMIVLVSAISFSAGYVVGRETGHAEAAADFVEVGADVVKQQLVNAKGSGLGLRRMAAGAAISAAA